MPVFTFLRLLLIFISAGEEKKTYLLALHGKMSLATVGFLFGASVNTPAFSTDGALGRFAFGKPPLSDLV